MAKDIAKREPAKGISQLRREMDRLFEDFFAPQAWWGGRPWKENGFLRWMSRKLPNRSP